MSDQGWTYGDLAGELYARGIDPDGGEHRRES